MYKNYEKKYGQSLKYKTIENITKLEQYLIRLYRWTVRTKPQYHLYLYDTDNTKMSISNIKYMINNPWTATMR